MADEKKVRKVAVIIALVLFVLIVLFFLVKYLRLDGAFDWRLWSGRVLIALAVVGGALAILFALLFIFRKDEAPTDLFKKTLDSDVVVRLWKQAVVLNTGIACVRVGDGKGLHRLVYDERDVIVKEELSFNDPAKETSDTFIRFEADIRSGDRRGVHSVELRTDVDEDWISKNWNWRMSRVSTNRYDVSRRQFPLTSAQDAQARLASRQLSALQSGELDADEMQYLQSLNKSITPAGAGVVGGKKSKTLEKSESLSSALERVSDDDDDDNVEADIEKFREDNK